MVASRIAYLVRHRELPQGYDYMGMIAGFPKVHQAYLTTNAAWIQQQAEREAQHQAMRQEAKLRRQQRKEEHRLYLEREARRQKAAEKAQTNRQIKKEEIAAKRAQLLPKLNAKIISLTAEEREWALYFKNVRKDADFCMVQ
jgi:flagellar biosynthesis component FlhA